MAVWYHGAMETIAVSIFRTHAERVGWWRCAVAAVCMYVSLPLFMYIHASVTLLYYKIFVRPLLALPPLRARDHVILDRYDISGLTWFDRINCLYCEYANGVTHLFQSEVDQVANTHTRISVFKGILLSIYLIPQTLLLIIGMLVITLPTHILVQLLGLHRASHKHITTRLRNEQYAYHYFQPYRALLRLYKLSAALAAYNLEQIESAWCPIKHLERAGISLPAHHKNFIDRSDLANVQDTLAAKGSVSDRLPKNVDAARGFDCSGGEHCGS